MAKIFKLMTQIQEWFVSLLFNLTLTQFRKHTSPLVSINGLQVWKVRMEVNGTYYWLIGDHEHLLTTTIHKDGFRSLGDLIDKDKSQRSRGCYHEITRSNFKYLHSVQISTLYSLLILSCSIRFEIFNYLLP